MVVAGRRVVNFGSDSFLGLDQDERVQSALRAGLKKWGTHNGASRVFLSVEANREAEEKLARWLKTESCLIYPSVTLTNYGAIPALVGRQDIIVADQMAHDSIHTAARIAQSNGVRVQTFAHNDAGDLERILHRSRPYRHALVAVDGVYSMSGDLPPLKDILDVTTANQGVLYVDDAHGTGVLGEHGRGSVLLNLGHYDNVLVVGSLSKAFSCAGGFIGCPAAIQRILKMSSNPYIFGGPVPPPYLEAILTVLDILSSDEFNELKARLDANVEQLTYGARSLGFRVLGGITPIVSLLIGDEAATLRAGHYLFERGFYVQSVIFPAVPYHGGVLRIQVNSNHLRAEIDGLLGALAEMKKELLVAA